MSETTLDFCRPDRGRGITAGCFAGQPPCARCEHVHRAEVSDPSDSVPYPNVVIFDAACDRCPCCASGDQYTYGIGSERDFLDYAGHIASFAGPTDMGHGDSIAASRMVPHSNVRRGTRDGRVANRGFGIRRGIGHQSIELGLLQRLRLSVRRWSSIAGSANHGGRTDSV